MKTTYKGEIYLSLAACIWGGMYVASKYALEVIPPFTLLFMRYSLASIILLCWCWRTGAEIIPKTNKWTLFQIGFIGYFLSIAAQFIGTKLSSAHMGSVITTLSPVFQSGFAILLLDEKLTKKQTGSVIAALAGMLLITGLPGINSDETLRTGNVFFLAAALFWGYCSVLAKKLAANYSAVQITTCGIILATLFTIPPALLEIGSWQVTDLQNPLTIFSICYLAIIATAVAFFCWNKGLSIMNPHQAGLFFFLQPVVGTILGSLLLGEIVSASFFVGSLLILAGVYSAS